MDGVGRYPFLVMTSVILSGGVKMRVEHGMLREVYRRPETDRQKHMVL